MKKYCNLSDKKSIVSKTYNAVLPFSILCLSLILPSGCAQKPWGDNLLENQEKQIRSMVSESHASAEACSESINAEIKAYWDTHLSDGAIKGYLQLFLPDSFKLVTLNPLGQPLFAFSSDGVSFQSINAAKGVFKFGKVASFVENHSLPKNVLSGNWAHWLSGYIHFSEDQITELKHDQTERGIWLTLEKNIEDDLKLKEIILFDTINRKVRERIVKNSNGHEVARIIYKEYSGNKICSLPSFIEIEGISFSAQISIAMSDFLYDQNYQKETFFLKLPPGYIQQNYR